MGVHGRVRLQTILMFVLSIFAADVGQAEDWPEFRGPTGQGLSGEMGLPLRWSNTQNVTWKVPIPGKGWSSPILYGNRIYLTTAVLQEAGNDQGNQSLRALCLDAQTGRTIWDVEVFLQKGSQADPIHNKNSHASPTPITDGDFLFVHFGTQGTACLTLDGEPVWKTRALKYQPQHGNGGSPVLVGDRLVITCDGADIQYTAALSRQTGEIQWKADRRVDRRQKFSFSTPLVIVVDGQQQIVSPGTNSVSAYAPQDGHEIWSFQYSGYSIIPRPVFGHGLVYVCTGYGQQPSLYAIRPDGNGNTTHSHKQWSLKGGVPHTPSLLLHGEELYFISDQGVATCVDAQTGAIHWRKRVGGNYSASPVYGDGKIYLQSEEGETVILRPGKHYQELARNQLNERTLASLAIADSALFIRTQQHLYRIEEQ